MGLLLKEKSVLEYMDASVRTNPSNKVCHNAISKVVEAAEGIGGGMYSTIRKLQDQSEPRECLNQLTQSIQALGKGSNSEQSHYQSVKYWKHNSPSHSIVTHHHKFHTSSIHTASTSVYP